MTNQLHELPDVPLEPLATLTPAPDPLLQAHLALVQMVDTAKRSGWPRCADQEQALAAARAALRAGLPKAAA